MRKNKQHPPHKKNKNKIPSKDTEKSWLSDGAVIFILIEYTRTVREES